MSAPRLKIIRGPEPGREFELVGDAITIGRGTRNEIIIRDNEVSKEHCRLIRVLDDYELHDLESTNGTFVNGKRVERDGHTLSQGNLVELGFSILLEFIPGEPTGDTSALLQKAALESRRTRFYLIIKRSSLASADEYALENKEVTLGRSMENDIVIPEPEVSKQHMRLVRSDDGYVLEDIGSLNGTYINDVRLAEHSPTLLRIGDVVRVGTSLEMRYTDESLLKTKSTRKTAEHLPARDTSPAIAKQHQTQALKAIKAEALDRHVFLAYARSEWDTVSSKLFAYLRDHGIAVWVDQALNPETEAWNQALEQVLTEGACLLVVASPEAVGTPYVRRSVNRFIARGKPVVVLGYKETNLPMMLQKAPFVPYDSASPEQSFRRILSEMIKANVPRQRP
ncbi:MAG: FHA domain-containing protein [Anaerolineae bacterium]|nr:FHA domain-containing protein [Anaerolineae bacterium]